VTTLVDSSLSPARKAYNRQPMRPPKRLRAAWRLCGPPNVSGVWQAVEAVLLRHLPTAWCHSRSVRRPADRRSCQPLIAAFATLTGIDRGNIRQLRPTLDTIGLFARSIPDIASLYAVLRGSAYIPPQASIRDLRIGICRTHDWQHAQPETVEALEDAAKALAAAGASVSEAPLPPVFDGIEETFGVISSVEASRALAHEARDHMPKLNSWIRDSLTAAARHDQRRPDRVPPARDRMSEGARNDIAAMRRTHHA